eukprot:GHUV01016072.1.p3 GENE.GHUV01016072.1~~GHUV01016072.1.p3  ORF type:complete len:102 (+),score=21.42 GHUV01016072.1:1384-1689(+)
MRFKTEAHLRDLLEKLDEDYGAYAEDLWAAQIRRPEQLASARIQTLIAAGVTVLVHADDIKARAAAGVNATVAVTFGLTASPLVCFSKPCAHICYSPTITI